MNTIYIICGASGAEGYDYISWEVEAHSTLESANARIDELHRLIEETQIQVRRDYPSSHEAVKLCEAISVHPCGDKNFYWNKHYDHPNNVYHVVEIPFIG